MFPFTSYFICTEPRSGSALLCEALENTGVAGHPEEHFLPHHRPDWMRWWGISTFADYLNKVIEVSTTPNGVFGTKLFWNFFDDFVGILRQTLGQGAEGLPTHELLSSVFPNLHYIWLIRHDKVQQAVSYWKAKQTKIWSWTKEEPPAPHKELKFSFDSIDELVHGFIRCENGWRQYFERCGYQPFIVIYENFVTTYEETGIRLLQFMDISVPENLVFTQRRLKRQADELSEEWIKRYFYLKQA